MKKIEESFVTERNVSKSCETVVNMFLELAAKTVSMTPVFSSTVDGGVVVEWSSEGDRLEVDVDRYGLFLIHSSVGADSMVSIHPSGFVGDLRDLAKASF